MPRASRPENARVRPVGVEEALYDLLSGLGVTDRVPDPVDERDPAKRGRELQGVAAAHLPVQDREVLPDPGHVQGHEAAPAVACCSLMNFS